ncbi:MAG TPA: polysaccharide deacetylase family protein [Solirubrobacteraceae bacterium]|nr:polysaccharide deacetylase family protein [Solirubrobacteraceae bacterium]
MRDLRPARHRRAVRRRRTAALVVLALASLVAGIAAGAGGGKDTESGGRASRSGGGRAHADPPSDAQLERRTVSRVLAYTSYISAGSPRQREVALTFDDGPGPYTPQILSILKREHVPATFFVVGQSLNSFAPALRQELHGGFPVEDHTERHLMLGRLGIAQQRREIEDQIIRVQSLGARPPLFFRPPYGSFDERTLSILRQKKLLMVLWTVDTEDWRQPGVRAIVEAAARARPGGIVLMHDAGGDRSQTVAALPHLIRRLRKRRLRLVTVAQLVRDDPPPRHQRPPTNLSGG